MKQHSNYELQIHEMHARGEEALIVAKLYMCP